MTVTTESTIAFPYKRSLGPVIGAFMTALTEQRILGIRNGDGVLCPPLEWDPLTGAELAHDFVEVGPAGTVQSWCWVASPTEQHPLDRPFAFATIRLDGADTALIHAVDAGSAEALSVGMRVAPRWRAERIGHITDIEAFVPGEQAQGGGGSGAAEPVTMMDYDATITYVTPVPESALRAKQATSERRLLGQQCPTCGRTYPGGKGLCPVDAIMLTVADEVDLPQRGVLSNYTIITPVQYPGQTETVPFPRVNVALDGVPLVLPYQWLVDIPADQVRIGMRLEAVWDDAAEERHGQSAGFAGWRWTGEPDDTDPTLPNRIY